MMNIDPATIDRLLRDARSYSFFTDMPVTEVEMRAIWDLAKMGPTSANMAPARIVWCRSPEAKRQLAALAVPGNGEKILAAPATAIIGMDHDFPEMLPRLFPHTDARSWFAGNRALIESSAFRNSSLQGAYFMIAARAVGLDVGPMSGFDHDGVDAAFFEGTAIKANFICMVGHGDPANLLPRLPRLAFEDANRIL